ncbi:hypothetical protein KAR26_02125 [Candidatus Parcubacteria bacterium]|nr:hypothetical protein [Candidatus Parcubacteria bacterium]
MTIVMVAIVAALTIYSYYQKTAEDAYHTSSDVNSMEVSKNANTAY